MRVGRSFDLLILIAAGLVTVEAMLLIMQGHSLTISGLGELSSILLTILSVQVILICGVANVIIVCRRLNIIKSAKLQNLALSTFILSGIVLTIEGLAAINISLNVQGAMASTSSMLAGLQLFCLGALVIINFTVSEDKPALPMGMPSSVILLFLLSLLPAAFLIA